MSHPNARTEKETESIYHPFAAAAIDRENEASKGAGCYQMLREVIMNQGLEKGSNSP